MKDTIYRADAIEAVNKEIYHSQTDRKTVVAVLSALPSADAVSREEYEELYRKAEEVNNMANDILSDFPSYKKALSAEAEQVTSKLDSAEPTGDLISRADAINAVRLETGKRGLLGRGDILDIIDALPSAELPKGGLISRADVVREFIKLFGCIQDVSDIDEWADICQTTVCEVPSAEITGALDDAIAKYVADGLMELPSAEAVQGWIPCSERLPEAEDMYQPPEQRYLCQLEAYGERKFCVLARLKGAVSPFWDWYGVAIHDSEVTAWMPLPKPYKGGDSE